jgi:ATP-dependent Lon protease
MPKNYRNSSRKKRFEIESVTSEDPYLTASIKDFPENRPEQTDTEFLQFLNL